MAAFGATSPLTVGTAREHSPPDLALQVCRREGPVRVRERSMVRWSNPSPIREWNVGYAYRKSRTAGVELNKPVRIAGIGAGYSRSAIARARTEASGNSGTTGCEGFAINGTLPPDCLYLIPE